MLVEKGFLLNLRKKFCLGKVIKYLNGILRERKKYEIVLVYIDIF